MYFVWVWAIAPLLWVLWPMAKNNLLHGGISSPAVYHYGCFSTPPLYVLCIWHTADNTVWFGGAAISGPVHHLELGYIVGLSNLWMARNTPLNQLRTVKGICMTYTKNNVRVMSYILLFFICTLVSVTEKTLSRKPLYWFSSTGTTAYSPYSSMAVTGQ